ncbi:[similarity to] glutamate/cysteine ligase [methanotrophic bacterial endosymbiont of Bathymodiolus sp.]|nr:[similarity to] glutamate/cysteine ligase [methanotrophic bacterial endosymbiont of Bathymodiolus sp.]
MDTDETDNFYNQALQAQRKLVDNPDLTSSARILRGMRAAKQSFSPFADKLSQQHTESFTQQKLNAAETLKFKLMASDSHAKQREIEDNDTLEFDAFLSKYFSQQ